MINTNTIRKVSSNLVFKLMIYTFFIAISYVLIYPFLYTAINAIKSYSDAYDATVVWVPKSIDFSNIEAAFKVFDFWNSLKNTLVYEIVASLIQFCTCAVAAYGLARFKLKGKKIMMGMLIINILVPVMMIITPSYVNFSHLDLFGIFGGISDLIGTDIRPNLVGTPWVFYLPALLSIGLKGGLFIYIYIQFFKGLPKELEEAAWIDGAGPWKTFLRIVVPSSGSVAITVLLFSIVWHWNDYYLAQMYMKEPTLAVAVNNYSGNIASSVLGLDVSTIRMMDVQILLSGCLLFILPLLIFYLIVQKKFIASIATTGIVG